MARQSQSTAAEAATLIGPGIFVRGRVSGEEDLHIEGRLEGSVVLTETVFVAPGGIVVATVQARDIVVSGVVVGNVTAEDSVTLNAGAKLVGDITAPRVIVADGATFAGNVAMGGEPPPPRKERRQAARRPAPAKAQSKPASKGPAKAASKASPVKTPPKKAANAKKAAPKTAAKKAAKAPSRVAAIPTPRASGARRDDDDTIVVKHAELENSKRASARKTTKKTTKKATPRARVPKPGKRRVGRR
ncbi:MAG: bactofilin family protein [Nannocystales bacterium]